MRLFKKYVYPHERTKSCQVKFSRGFSQIFSQICAEKVDLPISLRLSAK